MATVNTDGTPYNVPVHYAADAAFMMQLGAEGVFVGSGIFKSGNPEKRAAAIVKAVTNFSDAKIIDGYPGQLQSIISAGRRIPAICHGSHESYEE